MPETTQVLRTKENTDTPDSIPTAVEELVEGEVALMPINCNRALVLLQLVDAEGEQLDGTGTSVDVTVVVWAAGVPLGGGETTTIVTSVETVEGWVSSEPLAVEVPPGLRFWVGLGALDSPPGSIAAARVGWLPYKA